MATGKLIVKEGDREMTILIPGADQMDRNELGEILQWQEEKTRKELRQPVETRKHSEKEVGQALKDFNEFRHRKSEGTKRFF
jgi:hypothetical protein